MSRKKCSKPGSATMAVQRMQRVRFLDSARARSECVLSESVVLICVGKRKVRDSPRGKIAFLTCSEQKPHIIGSFLSRLCSFSRTVWCVDVNVHRQPDLSRATSAANDESQQPWSPTSGLGSTPVGYRLMHLYLLGYALPLCIRGTVHLPLTSISRPASSLVRAHMCNFADQQHMFAYNHFNSLLLLSTPIQLSFHLPSDSFGPVSSSITNHKH